MTASLRPLNVPESDVMERGVYRSTRVVRGQATYFSVTTAGAVLGARTIPKGKLSEATAVVDLWDELDAADPQRPALTLVKPIPGHASDPAFCLLLRPLRPRLAPSLGRPR